MEKEEIENMLFEIHDQVLTVTRILIDVYTCVKVLASASNVGSRDFLSDDIKNLSASIHTLVEQQEDMIKYLRKGLSK